MNKNSIQLQEYMINEKIDVIYMDDPTAVAYFTNFDSNPHERIVAYVIAQEDEFLFVPSLEYAEAKKQSNVENIITYTDDEDPWKIIGENGHRIAPTIQKVSVDEKTLTVERWFKLQQALSSETDSTEWDDISQVVEQMRVVKTDEEIKKMIRAGELADEAIQIGINLLEEGITELEIVAQIELEMKKRGVTEMSFSTLVLFGEHAANPHGNPGDRKLRNNEFVLFDLGVIYEGYASDATRTVAFGEVDEEKQKIYEIVLEAQITAQKAVKPGMRAGELDLIARRVIEDAGYGEYFTHRLGHGIGKTAHEFPSINGSSDTILEPGMCFSIEPGIYIQGDVGVRIEDCVYVTETGCEPFTLLDKELTTIIK